MHELLFQLPLNNEAILSNYFVKQTRRLKCVAPNYVAGRASAVSIAKKVNIKLVSSAISEKSRLAYKRQQTLFGKEQTESTTASSWSRFPTSL